MNQDINNILTKETKRRLDEMFTAFSTVSDGSYIFICKMAEDVSRWSKNAVDYFGLPGEYMLNAGDIWTEHIHPEDRENYQKSIERIFSGQDNGHDMQYRAMAKNGSYSVCTCRGVLIRDSKGIPYYFVGSIKNHGLVSYLDNTTGLRSMYGFFEDLRTMYWNNDSGLICQIGINSFSSFNDVYGYSFGDRILQTFARLLQKRFANVGCVYRLDGCKFAVVTHTLSVNEIEDIYNNIVEYVRGDFFVDQHRVNLSLSAGLVNVNDFEISEKTVYSCLKFAYYESKNSHMGSMYIFQDSLNDDNRQEIKKLNEIRNCVSEECKGFFLCYQPVMDSNTHKLKAMEALIRWENDEYGLIPPNDFIPILEQDAVFPVLGKWILERALLDGKEFLKKDPSLIINVNLSYAQLIKEKFVEEVFSLLEEYNFPAQNLCLEITERCRLMDTDLLRNIVNIFRNKGIKIALDDFGTGFSTLGILRELPVDIVKIDREYVKDIESSEIDQITVKCISEVASAFNADVCVEGIETEGMIERLKDYKVTSLQGYYFSKPIRFEEFMKKYLI